MLGTGIAITLTGMVLAFIADACQDIIILNILCWIAAFICWFYFCKILNSISQLHCYIFGAIFGYALLFHGPSSFYAVLGLFGIFITFTAFVNWLLS